MFLLNSTTVNIGRQWLEEAVYLALRVPTVLLPPGFGWNIALNPRHPELNITLLDILPLPLDCRLLYTLYFPPGQ